MFAAIVSPSSGMRLRYLHRTLRTFVALAVIALLTACSHVPPRLGIDGARPVSTERADLFRTRVNDDIAALQNGSFLLRVNASQHSIHQQVRQSFLFVRPDRVRSDFFSPGANQLIAMVIVSDGTIRALNLGARTFASGPATLENAERVLSLPFTPGELLLWVAGKAPLTSEASLELFEGDAPGTIFARWELSADRLVEAQFSWIDPASPPQILSLDIIRHSEGSRSTDRAFTSRLTLKGLTDGVTIPEKMEFWIPHLSLQGEFTYERADSNLDPARLPEALFQIRPPRNFRQTGVGTILASQ